jgi:hypothetical protein
MKLTAAIVAALVVASCSLGAAPTLTIPLDIPWGPGFSVLVFDTSRLVAGGRQLPANNAGDFMSAAIAHPERNEIDINWTGGACTHHPTVSLTGTANDLAIKVGTPSDPGPIPFIPIEKDCPLIGLFMGVTLTLSAPVEQQAITARFSQ